MKELREKARANMKGFCRVCPVCNGVACAGEVPGMGGSLTASAFKANVSDLQNLRIKMRTIHDAKDPDISFDFFGEKLSCPIITAPITGTKFNMGEALTEAEFYEAIVEGSKAAGTIAMMGDSAVPEFFPMGLEALKKANSKGVGIIKPKKNPEVLKLLELAESYNLSAVGMDIDGAGLITMALKGTPVEPKTVNELREIISATKMPFILKGILTPDEAELAVLLGAKAIVVSNHGGRVLDGAMSSVNALPEIVSAVKGKIMILADGGIRSGVDVFKMLALGADAVLIGRPAIIGAYGKKAEGVKMVIEQMRNSLYQTMILTGSKDLKAITQEMIY